MNKLAIPIVLLAVIMVAGIFAFSPVDTASTVHDTVSDDFDELLDLMCQEAFLNNYDDGLGTCDTD